MYAGLFTPLWAHLPHIMIDDIPSRMWIVIPATENEMLYRYVNYHSACMLVQYIYRGIKPNIKRKTIVHVLRKRRPTNAVYFSVVTSIEKWYTVVNIPAYESDYCFVLPESAQLLVKVWDDGVSVPMPWPHNICELEQFI